MADSLLGIPDRDLATLDSIVVLLNKASLIYEKAENWEQLTSCLLGLGSTHLAQGRRDVALSTFERALKLCTTHLGRSHRFTPKALAELGVINSVNDNFVKAKAYLLEAIDKYEKLAEEDGSNTALTYNRLGINFVYQSKFDSAIICYRKALKILPINKKSNNQLHASLINNIAIAMRNQGQYDSAMVYYRKSAAMRASFFGYNSDEHAASLANLGTLFMYLAEYDSSVIYTSKALEIQKANSPTDSAALSNSIGNLGIALQYKGNFDSAKVCYELCIEIQKRIWGEENSRVAGNYSNFASLLSELGEYDRALEYFKRTLKIDLRSGENNVWSMGSYFKVGYTYVQKEQYDLALQFLRKSESIGEKILDKDNPELPRTFNTIATVLVKKGLIDSALYYYNKSLRIYRIKIGPVNNNVASAYHYMALAHKAGGDLGKAMEYLNKAIEVRKQSIGEKHYLLAADYNLLGDIYYEQSLFTASLENYQLALESNYLGPKSVSDLTDKLNLSEISDKQEFLETLVKKGGVFLSLYENRKSREYPELALSTFKLADMLIDEMRISKINYEDKIGFSDIAKSAYESAIKNALILFDLTNEISYKKLAFFYAEKSKEATLSQAAWSASARDFGLMPKDLIDLENNLRVDRAYYWSLMQEELQKPEGYDSLTISQLEKNLFKTNRTYDSLIGALEQNYPSYYDIKYRRDVSSVDLVQERLSPKQMLISYFTGDSSIFVFTVTKSDFHTFAIPVDETYFNDVIELRQSLDPAEELSELERWELYRTNGYDIYNKFVDMALNENESSIDELIVIPDGNFGYIPFDVLLRKQPLSSNEHYKDLHYLFLDYEIHYGYSASLLFQAPTRNKRPSGTFLAIAPEYDGIETDSLRNLRLGRFRDQITKLTHNKEEVENISRYFDGVTLVGNEAVEFNFKASASQFNILHLAMHAIVDDQNPMNSKFVFSNNENDIEDNFLHAFELYNMQLSSEMVVLSACATGYGKLQQGEGIMSLARAFSYAGCPSVVMSHWSVNDQSTAAVMNSFYKYLAEGKAKSAALRQAKLDFLQKSGVRQSHPAYWGSFVVLGNNDPLSISRSWFRWWYAAILLVLVAGVVWRFRVSRS
ncbi:MAG: CHAT domain-containing tetratricopeptide repeat protein [Bacteroidota bacterium]